MSLKLEKRLYLLSHFFNYRRTIKHAYSVKWHYVYKFKTYSVCRSINLGITRHCYKNLLFYMVQIFTNYKIILLKLFLLSVVALVLNGNHFTTTREITPIKKRIKMLRPCKLNYLVLRYCRVCKKSAAGLYLSPSKNKYNGKKVCVQFSRLLIWIDQRETTPISRWRNSEHTCVFLWLYEVVISVNSEW